MTVKAMKTSSKHSSTSVERSSKPSTSKRSQLVDGMSLSSAAKTKKPDSNYSSGKKK